MQGQTVTLRTSDGYVATLVETGNKLEIAVAQPGNFSVVRLSLRAGNNAMIATGFYADAVTIRDDVTAAPQIGFGGSGASCVSANALPVGDFTVLEVTRNQDNTVATFAADFTYRCDSSIVPGSFGQLRYNSSVPVDTTRRIINSFSYPGVAGAAPGTMVTSTSVFVSGIEVPVPVSVSGGEISINGGTFTSSGGNITNGQSIAVRQVAAASANTLKTAVVNFGGYRVPFKVGTATGSTPQPNGEPLIVLRAQASATSPQQTVVYSPATLHNFGLGQGTYYYPSVSINLPPSYGTTWEAILSGVNGAQIVPGTYNVTTPYNGSSLPTLSTTGGITCGFLLSATMVVHEVAYSPQGIKTKLAADFVQQCNEYSQNPRIYGSIRLNSTVPINYTLSTPANFTLPMVKGAALSTWIQSNTVTVAGINVAVPVSIAGGEYSVDGGPFTSASSSVVNGQTLKVRLQSAAVKNTLVRATITVGGMSVPFQVGTIIDPLPQPTGDFLLSFVSTPRFDGMPNTVKIFSAANGDTLNVTRYQPAIAYIESGTWSAGIANPTRGMLTSGDYLIGSFTDPVNAYFEPRGSPTCSSGALGRLRVHDVAYFPDGTLDRLAADFLQATCDVYGDIVQVYGFLRINSTAPIDYAIRRPAPIVFTAVSGVALDALVISDEVMIRGINVPVPVTISGGEYSIDGGTFTSAPGTIVYGQRLRLRVTAASTTNAVTIATVTAGEVSGTFTTGTTIPPRPQPTGSPLIVLLDQNAATGITTETVLSAATQAGISWRAPYGDTREIEISGLRGENYQRSFTATIVGPGNAPLVQGTYVGANFYGNATTARFATNSGFSPSCVYDSLTKIVIHEIELSAQGAPIKLALDFQQVCPVPANGSLGLTAIYGYVRINSSIPIDYTVRRPIQFSFPTQYEVAPGSVAFSNEVSILGITEAVPVSVNGAEVSVDGGTYTANPGNVSAGQRIRLRVTAPSTNNAVSVATFSAGESSATFTVTTQTGLSPQPVADPLIVVISQGQDYVGGGKTHILSPATGRQIKLVTLYSKGAGVSAERVPGTPYYGDWSFVFSGPDGAKLTSATQYSGASRWPFQPPGKPGIDVGAFSTGCNGTGEFYVHEVNYTNDVIDKLAVDFVHYCTPSPLYGYVRINSTLPINQISDVDPGRLEFPLIEYVPRNTPVVSNAVTIANINTAAPISVAGGEFSIDGGAYTNAPGTISFGQVLRLRVLSSGSFQTSKSMSVTVGPVTATFQTYTEVRDIFANPINFPTVTNAPRSSWVTSQIVTLSGTNDRADATVYNGEMSVGGRPFTSAPQTIEPGETIQLRMMSSSRHLETYVMGGQVALQNIAFYVQTLGGFDLTTATSGNGRVESQPAGISCTSTCTQKFDAGSVVTLQALPGNGVGFTGWSGACSGTAPCNITMDAAKNVTAGFGITVPGAPTITSAVPGDGAAIISFAPPASNGGAGITGYAAFCNPGNITATASASPIVVGGLQNGSTYSCTVIASNSHGAGPASSPASVTPDSNVPLALVRVESRKVHGDAGTLNLPVDVSQAINGNITIESRVIGSGHQAVFVFNKAVTLIGNASAMNASGATLVATAQSLSTPEVMVTLPSVADGSRVTVVLQGVNGASDFQVSLGFLLGDVNGSGTVDESDVAALRARSGQIANAENLRFDIDLSGRVTAADLLGLKGRRGAVVQ